VPAASPVPPTTPPAIPTTPPAIPATATAVAGAAEAVAAVKRGADLSSLAAGLAAVAAKAPGATVPGTAGAKAPGAAASGPIYAAAGLDNAPPKYPFAARRRGLEGVVVVRARVRADGRSGRLTIAHSSGFAILDRAALAAVARWRFVPARRAGAAVAAEVEIPIRFALDD